MSDKTGNIGGDLERTVKVHSWIIVGVVVVVTVSFVAILITAGAMVNDSLAEKKAISQDMRDEIKAQNDKIDALTKALQNSQ